MNTQQKALIVKTGPEHTYGLDELNVKLGRGWRVVQMTSLGGAGAGTTAATDDAAVLCLAALVIVERAEEEAAELMEQIEEEEIQEEIDDIVEGNGASLDL